MLCNSYSLDIKSGTGTRYQSTGGDTRRTSTRAVAERETSTLDSGMGNTMEFRRYPKEETIASIDSGVTVREMREKRRQVKEEYQRMSNRLHYMRSKEDKLLNIALMEKYKSNALRLDNEKKHEKEQLDSVRLQKYKFEEEARIKQVVNLKQRLFSSKKLKRETEEIRKKKEVEEFKKRISSEKSDLDRLRQWSLEQNKRQHDSVLKMKEQQSLKKRIGELRNQNCRRKDVVEKISMYEDETYKTLELVEYLQKREAALERRNKACGKMFIKILDDFEHLRQI